ncbi:hypothetical protein EDC21_10389 [Thermohydrogenium kirishiense]|uniref:Uncharacterized protein n=1 Tax=Thermoanaerobacterium thermosaccharolyticum TaxID=1517 RepID=A0A231VM36_THETR|nr:hypothetical protein [Thermoanaerobacterium thermosaccharolyticum]OXT09323.1 hypothetical protein CE561_01370 [Thermoanaerobacterium thermosaccharolyticum]TCW41927.1 hypothetical protein EDC21_10389 [Thermohydrogenium kirishiense]
MKYYILDKFSRFVLYFLTLLILISVALLFIYAFVDVNIKGFNIELSILWWVLYIILLMVLSIILFSIAISQTVLLEDYLVISLGIMGFVRIRYDNIAYVGEAENRNTYRRGIHVFDSTCNMIVSKKDLLGIELKSPVKIYYFLFFERYATKIVFSTPNSKKLKEEIKNKI